MTCTRNFKRGWKCVIEHEKMDSDEPCGLIPRWWNWGKFARMYRKDMRTR